MISWHQNCSQLVNITTRMNASKTLNKDHNKNSLESYKALFDKILGLKECC